MARQADLLSVEEARARILPAFTRLPAESCALTGLAGRVLAEDISSTIDIPPFANSSMDGFAVLSTDTADAAATHPTTLRMTLDIPAGSQPAGEVRQGEAARIMTGAPLPRGADAVVPFEEVVDSGDRIEVTTPVRVGASVRRAGQDIRAGQVVLRGGTELGYRQTALLAAIGRGQAEVTRQPVVGVLSTGDELVAPGAPLEPGQIYNSNSPMLAIAIQEAGAVPRVIPSERDNPEAIASALRAAAPVDLLLTSGGASVGDHDHIQDVLRSNGRVAFWRVRVRPGKPLLFGSFDAVPVFGLPGNPASAAVTFELFARPAIRAMLGAPLYRPQIVARVGARINNRGGRRSFIRVRLEYADGAFIASPAGPQDSAMLVPLAAADGLLEAHEDVDELQAGDTAPVIVWRLPPVEP